MVTERGSIVRTSPAVIQYESQGKSRGDRNRRTQAWKEAPAGPDAARSDGAVTAEAIADAGLEKKDIDGFLVGVPFADPGMIYPASAAEVLGIKPRMLNVVDIGGASPAGMIWRAAAAIDAGMCNAVLCIVADLNRMRRSACAGDIGAARVRGALREYRRQLRLRDDRASPHVRVRHHAAADGEGRRRSAQQRAQESARDVQRQGAHDRRRAQLAHDRRSAASVRNRQPAAAAVRR